MKRTWMQSSPAVVKVWTLLSPFKQREFSVIGEAENSLFSKDYYGPSIYFCPYALLSQVFPNLVIAVPHHKEMRIAFAQFHVTKPFNRKNRNPPRLIEHRLSHPSTLRYLKYHLLSTGKPLSFNPLPTAKKPSPTHHL